MGLAPLTGVPLPFVSYGNSSLIVTLARRRADPQRRPRRLGEDGRAPTGGDRRGSKLRVVEGGRSGRAGRQPIERCHACREW